MQVNGSLIYFITWIQMERSHHFTAYCSQVLGLVPKEYLLGNQPREDIVLSWLGNLLKGLWPD